MCENSMISKKYVTNSFQKTKVHYWLIGAVEYLQKNYPTNKILLQKPLTQTKIEI